MMRILITGAAGFVGANLTRYFAQRGNQVCVIVRSATNTWRIDDIGPIHRITADINDQHSVKDSISASSPDVIIHTAAHGGYHFETDKRAIYNTNLIGTMNILDEAIAAGVKTFINTGSSSEYGVMDKPMVETDISMPLTDYAVSKALATQYCTYNSRKGMRVVTLRLFSVYGPYEEAHRLIPTLAYAYAKNTKAVVSSLTNVRDYVYVEDVCRAYELAIQKDVDSGSVINIGSGTQYTVQQAASFLPELELELKSGLRPKEEIKSWVADISLAKRKLGWVPNYSLENGLRLTAEWFGKNEGLYQNRQNTKFC